MAKEPTPTSEIRLAELEESTRAAPKDSELCLTLGEAYLRVDRLEDAALSYQRAVELDPRSDLRALYWEWLGLVREMEGRLEEALEAYFQWLDADPIALSPLDHLGTLLVVLERWTDLSLLGAQYTRRTEVHANPRARESMALYTFVTEQFQGGELSESKAATLAALELDPDSPSMRFLLGLLTYREGHIDLSRGEFERVLELDADGVWREPRFALDWNGVKARVMVAKLARLQGDLATALELLGGLGDLEQSDSEGLDEVADLLLEHHRYEELLNLLKDLPTESTRVAQLRAEGLLGLGRLNESAAILKNEAGLETRTTEEDEDRLSARLEELWELVRVAGDRGTELQDFLEEYPNLTKLHPLGACLQLWYTDRLGLSSSQQMAEKAEELCQTFPSIPEVWETAADIFLRNQCPDRAHLAKLMASKIRPDVLNGPAGTLSVSKAGGVGVLVVSNTEQGPLVVRIEADRGRQTTDQLFGWGCQLLRPGLELAKGAYLDLMEARYSGRALDQALYPRSFQVVVTPILLPGSSETLKNLNDGDLGSFPLGFLAAMLASLVRKESRQILVSGRLGLRAKIDGVTGLENALLSLQELGIRWDEFFLAESSSHRLLRCPAWSWYGRKITLLGNASDLLKLTEETSR